jgi:uncharacterized protein (DUF1778 family)
MSTTTIRLEAELKELVAAAAKRAGKTAHAFILDAIAQNVEQTEIDAEFHRLADTRWTRILRTAETVPADDVRRYLEARAKGRHPKRPVARKVPR